MKTKYLLIGLAMVLAAGGVWAGHVVWRQRHQFVTLNVRNMPLAEVLRKIERQTWKKIRTEKALDGRITLNLKDKPLPYVLDRIAEQAGAHWSTLYAVYGSKQALIGLDSALQGDGKLEAAGWTRIAPKLPEKEDPDQDTEGFSPGVGPVTQPDSTVEAPGPKPDRPRMMMIRRTEAGPIVFMGGPNGGMEMWSPEELVIDSTLAGRLGNTHQESATAQEAMETAKRLNAQWTSYFAFRKSAMGIGFAGPPGPGVDPLKRGPNDRFARLTPEQRVLRARERMGLESMSKNSQP